MGHVPRNAHTPTPGAQTAMNGGQQPGMEKRGPVEFNHAISYVNKIKVRLGIHSKLLFLDENCGKQQNSSTTIEKRQ
jgi:histone deacetylase complex regulatory component SIN3